MTGEGIRRRSAPGRRSAETPTEAEPAAGAAARTGPGPVHESESVRLVTTMIGRSKAGGGGRGRFATTTLFTFVTRLSFLTEGFAGGTGVVSGVATLDFLPTPLFLFFPSPFLPACGDEDDAVAAAAVSGCWKSESRNGSIWLGLGGR